MNILSIVETIKDDPVNAGQVALICLIGFVLVITVLVVLIFLLILFSKIFGKLDNLSFKKSKPAEVPAGQTAAITDEDEETVAAITAALIAFYDAGRSDGEDDVPPPFVIRSIKKN